MTVTKINFAYLALVTARFSTFATASIRYFRMLAFSHDYLAPQQQRYCPYLDWHIKCLPALQGRHLLLRNIVILIFILEGTEGLRLDPGQVLDPPPGGSNFADIVDVQHPSDNVEVRPIQFVSIAELTGTVLLTVGDVLTLGDKPLATGAPEQHGVLDLLGSTNFYGVYHTHDCLSAVNFSRATDLLAALTATLNGRRSAMTYSTAHSDSFCQVKNSRPAGSTIGLHRITINPIAKFSLFRLMNRITRLIFFI